MIQTDNSARVAIITGAAKRIGSVIASTLHKRGMNVVIHYRHSATEADALVNKLNTIRPTSAISVTADLADDTSVSEIVITAMMQWNRIDVLVNNASTFYPTPIEALSGAEIDELFTSNYRAPLLLAQAAASALQATQGSIINVIDTHAFRPYPNHLVYGSAKAALLMQTKALALELAPHIRVNGVAPGSILWPEGASSLSDEDKATILKTIPLERNGTAEDIANAVAFLVSKEANYITGQIISVDGGRSL